MTRDTPAMKTEHDADAGDSPTRGGAQPAMTSDSQAASADAPTDTNAVQPSRDRREHVPQAAGRIRRHALLLSVACAVAASLCLLRWNSTRALASELATRQTRAARLVADARAITALRERPQEVAETGLLRSDLLDRVNRAMGTAHLDAETLVSTLPQPPRARPGSEHAEVVNRLLFEDVSLDALVRFCHTLTTRSPELRIAAIQLRAETDRERWNADVSVSYWVFNPARRSPP